MARPEDRLGFGSLRGRCRRTGGASTRRRSPGRSGGHQRRPSHRDGPTSDGTCALPSRPASTARPTWPQTAAAITAWSDQVRAEVPQQGARRRSGRRSAASVTSGPAAEVIRIGSSRPCAVDPVAAREHADARPAARRRPGPCSRGSRRKSVEFLSTRDAADDALDRSPPAACATPRAFIHRARSADDEPDGQHDRREARRAEPNRRWRCSMYDAPAGPRTCYKGTC